MVKKIVFLLFILSLLLPGIALADGMIIPPPEYYIWETQQKAVIFHEEGREILVLSVSFQGNAEDFAWIVPTPSRPEVDKASDELFDSLEELTMPRYDIAGPMPLLEREVMMGVDKGVYVLETKQVEYYEIAVLAASDGDALVEWLNENGYEYPESAGYVLEGYIQNGWYFTAVKISDEYLGGNIEGQLISGHPVPLRLDFLTDKIVYPLKISSVQINEELVPRRYYPHNQVGILLYVFSDNRQELPKFVTEYAGWVEKDVIENLAYDDNGEPWLSPGKDKYFLTKLYRSMARAEMTNDLFLRQAKNNETVNAPGLAEERGWGGFITVMVIGGGLLLVLLLILIFSGMRKDN